MRPSSIRTICAAAAAAACLSHTASAEDIDLFTNPGSASTVAPNILIILDNSANWSRNDQAWPTGKQGESELRAIRTVLGDSFVGENVNLGLMMLTSGSPDGGYVRFHVSGMNATNKANFQSLINTILPNFDSPSEKTNSASTRYSAALFEAFKYFGGYTDPARANLDQAGSPVDSTHFGNQRYAVLDTKADPNAYLDASRSRYRSPINSDGSNSCAKNYIIFIGNGYPSQDNDPSLLTGINGNALVPPPVGNKSNRAANWAKYLYTTDVNAVLGRQGVATYTIDVFNAKPDPDNQTALLKAMAKYGGGRYFEARNEEAIIKALRDIIVEIQAVNSVFASASLPINATNRSQNANQVFIGMFRPDADAKPKWYGNLKQYKVALFGTEAKLADKNNQEALAASTGFVQACATSFWTTDSGTYWDFSAPSTGTCTSAATSVFSDLPDGSIVEKGGAAEVLRRGNNPLAPSTTFSRNVFTCSGACGAMVAFNSTNVTAARTGAATAAEHTAIITFTAGQDVLDENANLNVLEPRPSIHGDITHSRPLPVNKGGRVVVYYGSNDGSFKGVDAANGKEIWSFIAPEHHGKLKRLYANEPIINYPGLAVAGAQRKDYFFDGSAGLYQNLDDSKIWIFPTMRRGGRMVYAFDVSNPDAPLLKWARGCPNTANDTGCNPAAMSGIGQTWSVPAVGFIKDYGLGRKPVLIMGGGYDPCEDADSTTPTCAAGTVKGNQVYVIDGDTGAILATLPTLRSVAADVTLIDRDYDGLVDHGYAVDTAGNVYRIDFVDPVTRAARAPAEWVINRVAYTNGAGRKFLFGPSALVIGTKAYLALGSGDRERPLITNYPYVSSVMNRFYSFNDPFVAAPTALDLDGASMENFTTQTACETELQASSRGWYIDLNAGRGEQTVTSSVIFGGTVFFSTNRPIASTPGSCATNLGEARGYAVNLLNAQGIIGTGQLCGGQRSGVFTGGGLPPSPVIGTVPVETPDGVKDIPVLIGGIDTKTGTGPPIGVQEPPTPLNRKRSRLYWYPHGDR